MSFARDELIDALARRSGDVVLVDGENLRDEVKTADKRRADSSGVKCGRPR
jgi:hypothetical protein